MQRLLTALFLLSAGCPSAPRGPDACAGDPLVTARGDRADGHLFRALAGSRAAARCAPRPAARLQAELLGDLGLDAEAIAAWQRWRDSPGATAADRSDADAALAELQARPPADRAAPPEQQATAIALYGTASTCACSATTRARCGSCAARMRCRPIR
jgi:hypothetical protein